MSIKFSRARRLTYSTMLMLAVFTVTLLVSEVALRMTGRVPTDSVRVASNPTYDRIPGVFEPGQVVVERPRPELVHHVAINEYGFRGPEIQLKKRQNKIRILCLGDSFTYGSFVNNEDTFPYQLGERLAGDSVEVINGGVGGSTISDQAYFLRKALAVGPDIVLLTFSENDIDDLNKTVPIHKTMESNRRLKSGMAGRIYRYARNTAVFNFALLANARYSDFVTPRAVASGSYNHSTEADRLWSVYESELRAMSEYLKSRSIRFAFAVFPSDHRIGKPLPPESRLERVRKLADRIEIPTIELLKPLQESHLPSTDLYLLPYDGHPSRKAYGIVAESIASYLHEKQFIRKP